MTRSEKSESERKTRRSHSRFQQVGTPEIGFEPTSGDRTISRPSPGVRCGVGDCIAGADGCRNGWVVVREAGPSATLSWEVVPSPEVLFAGSATPLILAIDIPIGLPDLGLRTCDAAARSILGPGRGSSVFPAPIRSLLAASSHAEASAVREKAEGKRISIQTWAIIPKIRSVDALLQNNVSIRSRVREVHPEVCFYFMAGGRPMSAHKATPRGRNERLELLNAAFRPNVEIAMRDRRHLGCEVDDLLDAFAALWTARRIRDGLAEIIGCPTEQDSVGLPMEIVA